MWKSEHTVEADVTPEAVWARYTDLPTWVDWYPDVVKVSIDGPFETGTMGLLEQDPALGHFPEPVPFRLVDVVENKGWALQLMAPTSETGIQDQIAMYSGSRIEALSDGGIRISHWAELSGTGSEEIGEALGPMISNSIVTGLEALVKLVSD